MLFKRSEKPSCPVYVETKDSVPYCFRSSVSHGLGVFSKKKLRHGSSVGIFLHYNKNGQTSRMVRDELCRFMNHSDTPNVELKIHDDRNIHAYVENELREDEELFVDYTKVFSMLMNKYFPFIIDLPVRIRTEELKNFGRKVSHDGFMNDMQSIRDGNWR